MKKAILWFLVAAVIISMLGVFSLVGCKTETAAETTAAETTAAATAAETTAAATAAEEVPLKFAFSVAILDNPYFIEVANGFKDKCEELGIEALVGDAKYDAAEQYGQFENYISLGVDAIAAAPVDAKSLIDIVSTAKDAGIVVVGQAQGIENANGNYIVDDYAYGEVVGTNAATWINEKFGGKANVIILALDNVEDVIKRGNGMTDVIEKTTESKVLARQAAQTIEEALSATETLLTANPEINVIACVNDQLALGALEAVKVMGIDNPNFYIGGADNTAEARAKMTEENSYFRSTVDIDPYGTGERLAEIMLRYIKEGTPQETENIYFDMIPVWQDEIAD